MALYAGPNRDPNRYRLLEIASRAPNGHLWKASPTERTKGGDVAVKVAQRDGDESGAHREDWFRRAEALKKVKHKALVRVLDAFEGPEPHTDGAIALSGDTLFMVEEWVDGVDFRSWIREHADEALGDRLSIVDQIARAVDHLHGKSLVVGGLRPGDVIVDRRNTARLRDLALPDAHDRIGALRSMAPEVRAGSNHSAASDRYDVGALAYLAVTGFDLPQPVPPPERIDEMIAAAGAPPEIGEQIRGLLHSDPANRPEVAGRWSLRVDPAVIPASTAGLEPASGPSPSPPAAPSSDGMTVPRADVAIEPVSEGDLSKDRDRRPPIVLAAVATAVVLAVALAAFVLSSSGDGEADEGSPTTGASASSTGPTAPTDPMVELTVPDSLMADEGSAADFTIEITVENVADPITITVDPGDGSDLLEGESLDGDAVSFAHMYMDDGVYTLNAEAQVGGTVLSRVTTSVTVDNVAPVVTIGGPVVVDTGGSFSLDVSVVDPGSDTHELTVVWGDGEPVRIPLVENPTVLTHAWQAAGAYEVRVSVTDDDGGAAEAVHTVEVQRTAEDVVLFDPAAASWTFVTPSGSRQLSFGTVGDLPLIGDWNCDGLDSHGVYRPSDGRIYVRNTIDEGPAEASFAAVAAYAQAVAGDFDGNGCDEVALRNSVGSVAVLDSLGERPVFRYQYVFGDSGDTLIAGDVDGDGIDELGVFRDATAEFFLELETGTGRAEIQFPFGSAGDLPVLGDWDGDGVVGPGVFRPSAQTFYVRNSLTEGAADTEIPLGPTGIPLAGRIVPVVP